MDDARFVYPEPVFVGTNIDAGEMGLEDTDWEWNDTPFPPEVTILNDTMFPEDALIEVDYQYVPLASRNDPEGAVTNRVDIWVGGSRSVAATQSCSFSLTPEFNETADHVMNRDNWVRTNGEHPADTNIFVPLAFGPIISVPPTLNIGGNTYGLADDDTMGTTEEIGDEDVLYAYRIVHDDTVFGYTATSRYGLEWHNAVGYKPAEGATFTIGGQISTPYLFNVMIRDIQTAVEKWRLLGVDAQVHQAKLRELRFNFAIMYSPQISRDVVNSAIDTALADFLLSTSFQGRLQVSDLIQVVHNVQGVDNVRFLRGDDHTGYVSGTPNLYNVGIQRIADGEVVESYVDAEGRTYDLKFGDDELPLFNSAVKSPRAENSFGGA